MAQSSNTDDQVDSTGNDGGPTNDGGGDESIVDLAQQPIVKQWTKFITILFAFAGVGAGLTLMLRDIADQSVVDSDGPISGQGIEADAVFFSLVDLPSIIAVVAVFVGVYLGWNLRADDQTTYLASGISIFAGTVVSLILFVIFHTVATDLSVDFGALIISSIVSGLGVSVAAVGGAWASRNAAPEATGSTGTVDSQPDVHASD